MLPLHRYLTKQIPSLPYTPRDRNGMGKRGVHKGQAKLYLSELQFMIHHAKPNVRGVVIYVGASPGNHIPDIVNKFPNYQFVLIDPSTPCVSLQQMAHDKGSRVRILKQYATPGNIKVLSSEFAGYDDLIMISDIRTIPKHTPQAMPEHVELDMALQERLVYSLSPRVALLKMCLPWVQGRTEYFDGEIYLPVWGRPSTTETRLVVQRPYTKTVYCNDCYNNRMHYFNKIMRPSQCPDGVFYDQRLENAIELEYMRSEWNE